MLVSSRLERFKAQGKNAYNFRCPLCGDSHKDKRRTRGYIVSSDKKQMTTFFCHNCGASMSLGSFLRDQAPDLYSAYKMDKFGKRLGVRSAPVDEGIFANSAEVNERRLNNLLNHCVPLIDHPTALEYAKSRKLPEDLYGELYGINDVRQLTSRIDKYKDRKFPQVPALVIPFFNEDGSYDFIQCRVIGECESRHRFITLEINETSKIYGTNRVVWSDPVYVLEGPIDAMFIDNAMATAGAAAGLAEIERQNRLHGNALSNICLLFDNDYKTNPEILDYIIKYSEAGYSVVLYDRAFDGIKDVNEAVQKHGWTREEVNDYVRGRTYNGLRAKLELSSLQKRRSNEKKNNSQQKRSSSSPTSHQYQ